jgi:uncharacterized protein
MLNRTSYRHGKGLCIPQARSGVKLESRAEGKPKVLRGYAAVFFDEADPEGTEYWLWSDVVERLAPGCFDRAIKEKHDARCVFNHDADQLLGRVSAGTLRLSVDAKGLIYECDEDANDPDWQRVAAKVDRGDITGSSFAFMPTLTTWTEVKSEQSSYWVRTIQDVDLYDASPVTWPAYTGTTSGRSDSQRLIEPTAAERALLLAERDRFRGDDLPEINARLAELGLGLLR